MALPEIPVTDTLLHRLAAEAEIRNLHARYARGVDRRDWESVRACYHPGAIDWHGSYRGDRDGFIDWVRARHAAIDHAVHFLGQVWFDWQGPDRCRTESYFIASRRVADSAGELRDEVITGRYLDLFEARAGVWAIAAREVVYDLAQAFPVAATLPATIGLLGRRDASDPGLQRGADRQE